MKRRQLVAWISAAWLSAVSATSAQVLTTETLASGFDRPLWAGSPPGDERIFVCEQNTGLVRIVRDGEILPTPFLDLGDQIVGEFEQGLLSLAFHPKFSANGLFFVTYTAPLIESPGSGGAGSEGTNDTESIVSRFRVSSTDPDVANPASELILLRVPQFTWNHNVMHLAFGPDDGYMYIGSGDGGGFNDPFCRAQQPDTWLGKMLRIDVDSAGVGQEYTIPPDNPFVGDAGILDEIWAFGLRNPWRFSFDRLTGDLYLGDVGENDREEFNFEPAGAGGRNYGWPVMEGDLCSFFGPTNCDDAGLAVGACFDASFVEPFHANVHPEYRAAIGGVVYRGCRMPELWGTYLFADKSGSSFFSAEVTGGVASNVLDRTAELGGSGNNPVHLGEDGWGEILIVEHAGGRISKVLPAAPVTIADCDGNGLDDGCEAAIFSWADTDDSGVVDACESLSVDTDYLCVTTGGAQNLRLHPGAFWNGSLYLIAGSFSGTAPGIPFGPVTLPLNYDAYLKYTVTNPNSGPLTDSLGVLDGGGTARAGISSGPLGAGSSLTGLTAYHAFALVGPLGSVDFTSNSVRLRFVL